MVYLNEAFGKQQITRNSIQNFQRIFFFQDHFFRHSTNCNWLFILVHIILVLCLIAVATNADDRYCSPAICPPGTHHIACGRDLVCEKKILKILI